MTSEELEVKYPSCTHKLATFQEMYALIAHLPGDFAEFGVFNGNGTRELASLDPRRTAWAFDTFEGMPKEDYNGTEDDSDPVGKWKPDGSPAELFEGLANVKVMQGRFADTLPLVPDSQRFLLVHLDCDWYNSYTQVLRFLESHLTPQAALLLDDYPHCAGCVRAVNEWVTEMGPRVSHNGQQLIIWHGPDTDGDNTSRTAGPTNCEERP